MTGAALRVTWPDLFLAGAILETDGMEESQRALVRGCQLCTQLSILEGNLGNFLSFLMLSSSTIEEISQIFFVIEVVNFKK